MPKSPEQSDFSKLEDQQGLTELSEAEQREYVERAHKEAIGMDTEMKEKRERGLESKTVGPMTVIYRDNDLFQEYIPVIKSHIESLDGEIQFAPFPKGTDEHTIQEWYQKNRDTLAGRVLLTDNTCYPKYEYKIEKSAASQPGKLDTILETAFFDGLKDELGKEFFSKDENNINSFKGYNQVFPKIFKMLLSEKANRPREIHIIQQSIADHLPSRGSSEADIEQAFASGQDAGKRAVAERFKKYIEAAGFRNENVVIQDDISEEIDKEDNWILIDRHNKNLQAVTKATALVLPFSNFMKSITERGLLELPKEKIKENLIPALNYFLKKDLSLADIKTYLEKHHFQSISYYDQEKKIGSGILYERVLNSEEADKIVKYWANLIFEEKEFHFGSLSAALKNPKISNQTASELTREAIDKKGFDRISDYLEGDLLSKLDSAMFEDIVREYEISSGGWRWLSEYPNDKRRGTKFTKYQIEKTAEGLRRLKISTLLKDENGKIVSETPE